MGKLWEPQERYNYRTSSYRRRTPSGKDGGSGRWRRVLWQILASMMIFVIVWGVFQVNTPLFRTVQGTIRGWFSEDYSIEPVIKLFSEVGLWGNTFDRAAFEASKSLSDPDLPDPGPLAIPVSGQIVKPFGWVAGAQPETFHDGIIIAAPEGTPVKAAQPGVVSRIANEEEKGRLVQITSSTGFVTTYAHLKEILVNLNDQVMAGQVVGKVGKTGKAEHFQLYFSISRQGEPLDPAKLLMPDSQKT